MELPSAVYSCTAVWGRMPISTVSAVYKYVMCLVGVQNLDRNLCQCSLAEALLRGCELFFLTLRHQGKWHDQVSLNCCILLNHIIRNV